MTSPLTPRTSALRVMLGPREGWLELEVPASAEIAVIGWIQQRASVDAEVPAEVATLLSRALTRSFRVTFLDPGNGASTTWKDQGDRWTGSIPAAGWASLFRSKDLPLTSTSDAALAQLLFDAAGAWNQEAQFAWLTAPESLPSEFNFEALVRGLQHGRLEEQTLPVRLCGLLIPGPDGDFAQLVMLETKRLEAFLNYLQDEAQIAGIGFNIVSAAAFRETEWFVDKVQQ